MKNPSPQSGFSLLEVTIAAAILGGLTLVVMKLFETQQKNANYFEFIGKREQLRIELVGQVLSQPDFCRCLFDGAQEFPASGTAVLAASNSVTKLGRMNFPTPGSCVGATMPAPMVTKEGVDGIKLESVAIRKIAPEGGVLMGNFEVLLSSVKEVTGVNLKGIRVKVGIDAVPAGPGMVSFRGCSMKASDATSVKTYSVVVNRNNSPATVPKTTLPFEHSFCALAVVQSGGNDGGGADACRVTYDPSVGTWTLTGNRGDDPAITCTMICR